MNLVEWKANLMGKRAQERRGARTGRFGSDCPITFIHLTLDLRLSEKKRLPNLTGYVIGQKSANLPDHTTCE